MPRTPRGHNRVLKCFFYSPFPDFPEEEELGSSPPPPRPRTPVKAREASGAQERTSPKSQHTHTRPKQGSMSTGDPTATAAAMMPPLQLQKNVSTRSPSASWSWTALRECWSTSPQDRSCLKEAAALGTEADVHRDHQPRRSDGKITSVFNLTLKVPGAHQGSVT